MRPYHPIFVALAAAMPAPAVAHAACTDWQVGPLLNTALGNGADDYVHALASWDPDGAGPEVDALQVWNGGVVAAGGFSATKLGAPLNHIARLPNDRADHQQPWASDSATGVRSPWHRAPGEAVYAPRGAPAADR